MRRIKSEGLHPASQIAQAIGGSYADPDGTAFRFDGGGVDQDGFDGMTILPSYPITNAHVQIWNFDDNVEISSDIWTPKSGNHGDLELIEGVGGGADYTTAPTFGLNEYHATSKSVEIRPGKDIWINADVKIEQGGTFLIGFDDVDGSVIGGDVNQLQFRFEDDMIRLFSTVDGDQQPYAIADISTGGRFHIDISDDSWHTINIHFESVGDEFSFYVHLFIDGYGVGSLFLTTTDLGMGNAEISNYPTVPMNMYFGTSSSNIITSTRNITLLQDVDDKATHLPH